MKRTSTVGKLNQNPPKKTSTSANMRFLKTSSMNKHKKRCFKRYRGQGGR